MPGGAQLEMDWLLAHGYPLVTVEEAAFLLECKEDRIFACVEDGGLPAVNIALSLDTRRMIRVWRWAVLHARICPEKDMTPPVMSEALFLTRDIWLMRETAACLRCSTDHVLNLYDATPALLTGPDRNVARDARREPRILRASLELFLETRAIE